jgi:hypothetical protein
MRRLPNSRRRPSLNALIAFCALLVALGGTAIAAGGHTDAAADKKLAKKVLKKLAPTLAVKNAKNAKSATTAKRAQNATTAQNATKLGGQAAGSFASSSKVIRYGFRLPFGQTRNIATAGPFTLTAQCLQDSDFDATPGSHRDIAVVEIATTQNGSVFDASDAKRGGALPTDFLNTDTAETDRIWTKDTVATGTTTYEADPNDDGAAQAPDGTSIEAVQDLSGNGINLPGLPGCVFHGAIMVDN